MVCLQAKPNNEGPNQSQGTGTTSDRLTGAESQDLASDVGVSPVLTSRNALLMINFVLIVVSRIIWLKYVTRGLSKIPFNLIKIVRGASLSIGICLRMGTKAKAMKFV